ncbi:MAG: hypothetical protein U0575_11525 [Phycisphaerales bacterium]
MFVGSPSLHALLADLGSAAVDAHRIVDAAVVLPPEGAPLALPAIGFRVRRTTLDVAIDVQTRRSFDASIGVGIGATLRHTLLDVGRATSRAEGNRVRLVVDSVPPPPWLRRNRLPFTAPPGKPLP